MPKSGQEWNRNFLLGHPLFAVFEPWAQLLRVEEFPEVELLTWLAEQERARRAPTLRPLHFCQLKKKPRRKKRTQLILDELYDGSIALRGQVPCLSASYHDLFNALAFAAFLRSKRKLHERQFSALKNWVGDAPQLPGKRTREQDALTIFDEGGVVIAMCEPFLSTWRSSSTPTKIPAFSPSEGVVPLLFGHALLEHLYEGHTQVRASAVVLELDAPITPENVVDVADHYLAARLSDPQQFNEPGADGIFTLDGDDFSLGPPKPAWSAWVPGDREAFDSRYAPVSP